MDRLERAYRAGRALSRHLQEDDRTRPVVRLLANFEKYFIGVALVAIVAILAFDITVRNLPGVSVSMSWRNDIVIGLFVWMAWVGMAWGVKRDTHFRFLLIRNSLSNTVNYVLYWLEWLIWLVFLGVVVRYSIPVLERWMRAGDIVGTDVPRYFLYVAVPVGFGITFVRVLGQMASVTRRYRAGETISPDSSIQD